MGASVHQLVDDHLHLVNGYRVYRLDIAVALGEGGEHVACGDGMQHSRQHDHEGGALGEVAHFILGLYDIGYHLGQRTIIADGACQQEGDAIGNAGVHDAIAHKATLHRARYTPRVPDAVYRVHVVPMPAQHGMTFNVHSEGCAVKRLLKIVHRHRVAAEDCAYVAVGDEPGHALSRPSVHHGRSEDPDAAPIARLIPAY